MKRLAVIPSDPISAYLAGGYDAGWLRRYYNPGGCFDEVYLLSPLEEDSDDLLGMRVVKTQPEELPARISALDIDVVRAYGGFWAADMACLHKCPGVPVIVSVHDTRSSLVHDSVMRADYVWCVSRAVARMVRRRVGGFKPVWLLPNRVDTSVMRPRTEPEWRELRGRYPFRYCVVHVGRRQAQKNLDTLIKSLAIAGRDYCLVAIGAGDRAPYEALARECGVAGRCYFIDSVAHRELSLYYSMADCTCVASRFEGFGMVFIEALACGGVVVTSDIAPMNEFVRHNSNGILVKAFEDPAALARALVIACTNTGLRGRLRSAGPASVQRFDTAAIQELETGYYRKVLAWRGTPRGLLYNLFRTL